MDIMTDAAEARRFARNMAETLKDPASWQGWHALEIRGNPPLDWIRQAKVTAQLQSYFPKDDGTLLWLDGAVVIVYPGRPFAAIGDIPAFLREKAGLAEPLCREYAIDRDTGAFIAALEAAGANLGEQAKDQRPQATYAHLRALVPDIEDLLGRWHVEHISRKGREKPLIMVVDDDPLTLQLVRRALVPHFDVVTAPSGAEAISQHLKLMPDIIFLDIGLPDCDGLTLLAYMQQYDPECRIVMFSADNVLKTRVTALAGGAKGFLPKPFSLAGFHKHILSWLSGQKKDGSVDEDAFGA